MNKASDTFSGLNYKRLNIIKYLAIFALLIGSISTIIYAIDMRSAAIMIAYFAFGCTGMLIAAMNGRSSLSLYVSGYGLACFVSVILFYIYLHRYGAPYFIGGSDDLTYEKDAFLLLSHGLNYDRDSFAFIVGKPWHNSVGYIYLTSLFVRAGELIGGYDTLIPRLFNALILGLTAVIVAKTAKKIGLSPAQSVVAGLWIILFPMMLYSSAHVFRDTITGFILMLGLYFSLCISFDERKVFHISWLLYTLPFLLLVPVMSQLRALYVIPLLAMIISSWAFKFIPIHRYRLWHLIAATPFLIALSYFMTSNELVSFGFRAVEAYGIGLADGRRSASDGLSVVLFNLPQPLQTLGRVGYSIITPLPVLYDKIEWNFLGLGTALQVFFAAYVFLGLKAIANNPRYMPLIIGFVIIYFSYAMGTFTFRHITQWFPFALLIGMVGFSYQRKNHKLIMFSSGVFLIIFYFSYIILKS